MASRKSTSLEDMQQGERTSVLSKFKNAGAAAVQKKKEEEAAAEAARLRKEQGPDMMQWGSLMCACFMVLWIISCSVVASLLMVRYLGMIEEDQSWYVMEGSIGLALAKATPVLQAAGEARDAVSAAIEFGHVGSSYDYAGIERALAPVLLSKPYVQSIELAFSDREAALLVSHRRAGDEGQRQLMLQSNADDCFLMGPEGCADLGAPQGKYPAWVQEAMFLDLRREGLSEGAQGPSTEQLVELSRSADATEDWLTPPSLRSGILEGTSDVVWVPTLRLIFRVPLPKEWSSVQREILVGKVTMEVAQLSGDLLVDAQLGSEARIFIVDRNGVVLSSSKIQETLTIDSDSASIKFRTFSELPDSGDWAGMLTGAFSGGKVSKLQTYKDGIAAVVAPLEPPLDMFGVIVVSPVENTSFKDDFMYFASIALTSWTYFPYLLAMISFALAFMNSTTEVDDKGRPVASRTTRMASRVSGVARQSVVGMQRRASVAGRASINMGSRGSIMGGRGSIFGGAGGGAPGQTEEDEKADILRSNIRATVQMNDLMFAEDKSCRGKISRCLRSCCGKGRGFDD